MAAFYSEKGITIDNLVLIGAPINKSLLKFVEDSSNVKKTIVINLTKYSDPIYAGMSDIEIIKSAPILANQMISNDGHFYYSGADELGKKRRRELAKNLYDRGVK